MPVTRKRKQDNSTQTQSSQSARTHLEFSAVTKFQALHRQWNRCANCGTYLSFKVGRAHHVIPAQTSSMDKPADTFLRSVDNCVILCNPCYDEVNHSGNHGDNAITSLSVYRYSHGLEKTAHRQWGDKLSARQTGEDATANSQRISILRYK